MLYVQQKTMVSESFGIKFLAAMKSPSVLSAVVFNTDAVGFLSTSNEINA